MALYLKKELDDDARIYVWEITETEEELMANTAVPDNELEELSYTKSEARRKEKLATRALLNEIFPEKLYLGHHDNGKPYLQNTAMEISISHTNRFVAILLHPDEDLGIDIECLDRDFSAVEKKALSEDELEAVAGGVCGCGLIGGGTGNGKQCFCLFPTGSGLNDSGVSCDCPLSIGAGADL